MNEWSDKSATLIWRHRWGLAFVVVAVTLAAFYPLSQLGVSNALSAWYPDDDPELINYREFQDTYGSDEIIVVAVRGDLGFDTEPGLTRVGELTDRLLDIEGVATVTSLVTVPTSLAAARGRLLSADAQTTALIVQTLPGPASEAVRGRVLDDVRQAVSASGLEGALGGYGVVFEALNEASTRGASSLIAMAHLLMLVVLAVLLRNWRAVLLVMITVGTAVVWTMGLYAATGHELNMVTMVLPTLVLVIGIANCLHVLRSVAAVPLNADHGRRVVRGLADVISPCFLMTVTTAAGFLGLTWSSLPVVQELGWFGAVGVLAAFICSTVLITAGLSTPALEPRQRRSRLDGLALRFFRTGRQFPRVTVGVFVVLALVATYGISQLESDTDSIGYMKKTHVVRQDSDLIEAEIGPYVPIEFIVTVERDIFDEAVLDAIWQWQQAAEQLQDIGWSWSLVSAMGLEADEVPSEVGLDALRARLVRMRRFSPATVAGMWNGDRELRISFGAPIMSARGVRALIEALDSSAGLPPGSAVRPAGYSPLYTRIVDEIVNSQLRGFGAAIMMIVVLIGLAMRSWRRMLLALPANAMPVMLTLGLMGLTGIPLDVASATIASVILGLVVDDTVHLLRPGPDTGILPSLKTAATRAGGTLVMTSVVLAAGFLVLGLAEIRSIAWFGVLTSFAVIVAIVTDLLLLPAVARLCEITAPR